ncbi:MAG: ADP-glyceromanno-heptose 6-epimerase [Selenomonadaceae bacterium]|nr:ADP-glyceromanno-heptose 6-epimerase [Selenomonadaceae bacterium]
MIIITGGAGFIGSNLVRAFNERKRNDILIVDNLGEGEKYKNLLGLRFYDYVDKHAFLHNVMDGVYDDLKIEAIFHEGACSDTMEYNVNYMVENNFEYSKTLLSYAMERDIPFLYASSASTYGLGKFGFYENDKCENALNPYAFSKLIFDRYVKNLLPKAKSQIAGLRYFNVFGPQEYHKNKMASVFFHFYNQINENGEARLFEGAGVVEDGEQKRDFVYVKDIVNINLWFFEHPEVSGIYNAGTGKAHSYNDAVAAVIKAMGKGTFTYVDFPEVLRGKYQFFTESDNSKLLEAGYDKGFYDFEEAVAEYVDILDDGGYFSYV